MSEIKVHPASMSADSSNAFYLKGCETVQHSPSYAACLFRISEHEQGRTYPGKESCIDAINSNKCRAKEMRQQEQLAGQALYYFQRQFIQNKIVTSMTPESEVPKVQKTGWTPAPIIRLEKKELPTAQDKEFDGPEDGFAAAINAEMQNLANAEMQKSLNAETKKPVFEERKVSPTPVEKIEVKQEPKAGSLAMLPGETPLQYARRSAIYRKSIQEGQPA